MTHDPREKLREVAHVHRPLLLEVREQALERHAPLGKPGPRPVVLAVEDSEQTFPEHPRTLPGLPWLGEEVAEDDFHCHGGGRKYAFREPPWSSAAQHVRSPP